VRELTQGPFRALLVMAFDPLFSGLRPKYLLTA